MCGAGEKVFIRKWCALEMNRQREIPGREMQCPPELLIPGGRQHDLDFGAAHDPAWLDRERDSPFPATGRNMDRPPPPRPPRPSADNHVASRDDEHTHSDRHLRAADILPPLCLAARPKVGG